MTHGVLLLGAFRIIRLASPALATRRIEVMPYSLTRVSGQSFVIAIGYVCEARPIRRADHEKPSDV